MSLEQGFLFLSIKLAILFSLQPYPLVGLLYISPFVVYSSHANLLVVLEKVVQFCMLQGVIWLTKD